MAKNYRIIDFRGPDGGYDPSDIVTKDELFDASTGKIKPELIDASISAEIDLVKICTNAEDTPYDVSWEKSEFVTVTGILEASYATRSYVYMSKNYYDETYTSYVTAEDNGEYRWVLLSANSDLSCEIVEEY